MKAARLVILGIAPVAGGAAAFPVGGEEPQQAQAPEPAIQLATVDVLIAKSDIGDGSPAQRSLLDANNHTPPPEQAGRRIETNTVRFGATTVMSR